MILLIYKYIYLLCINKIRYHSHIIPSDHHRNDKSMIAILHSVNDIIHHPVTLLGTSLQEMIPYVVGTLYGTQWPQARGQSLTSASGTVGLPDFRGLSERSDWRRANALALFLGFSVENGISAYQISY
jgi:hypothetical protein